MMLGAPAPAARELTLLPLGRREPLLLPPHDGGGGVPPLFEVAKLVLPGRFVDPAHEVLCQ